MEDDFLTMIKLGVSGDRRHSRHEGRRWAIERSLELNRGQLAVTASVIIRDAERILHFVLFGKDELRPGTED